MPNEIPKDSSFVKELDFVYVVVTVYRDESGKPELSVFVYKSQDDAQKRFERIMELHKKAGPHSSFIMTTSFMAGVYENFEQSLFAEGKIEEGRVM